MAARSALLILAALALACLPACVQDDGTRFNPIKDMTTVSDDEERELGLEFDRELRKKVTVIEDPVVAGFINDLGQEIVRTIEPQPFIYRFRVIQDPSLNAFAVPGGYVYFHSGTLLAAGSIDELAGVMSHEIAHVKAHHYARMQKKSQIPDLLVGLAGMAAAVATGEPGIMVAAQAANVAVKLKFSREFENESDRLGSIFMTRAGFDPAGITRFFEHIVREQKRHPHNIPPYLFSHPDVEDRIETVTLQAQKLRPTRVADPRFNEALYDAQARLAYLIETGRTSVPPHTPPPDLAKTEPLLAEAALLADDGRTDEALLLLTRAEAVEPGDPRVPFQIGELLAAQGRPRQAAEAYRRTIRLDPTRALVFYKLGLCLEAIGDRHSAVHAYEQASQRAGNSSVLRERAEWQIETLVFPMLLEAGFADGAEDEGDTPLGRSREAFAPGVSRVAWWARLHSRYGAYVDRMSVRWIAPSGAVVQETPVERRSRSYIGSVLELSGPDAMETGEWTVEARFEDDVVAQHSFRIQGP
ncbi:MAG: M48 family metalloprotease [Deltaproteobacteria bacterium]|nr:M48 family metalloprotease [Deltaproteobacteria bacterium]